MTTVSILLLLYFLPILVAWLRGVSDLEGVFMANLFFGWTGIGWLWAANMACTRYTRRFLNSSE